MCYLLPLVKFPTRPIFIDDNEQFLNILEMYFKNSNPILLPSLSEFNEFKDQLQGNKARYDENSFSSTALLDDYFESSVERFSSIFIDYHLPNTNGLDIASKLKKTPYSRILLSGVADEKIAVEAFNSGMIEAYVNKSNKDIFQSIKQTLNLLDKRYFVKISKNYEELLSEDEIKLLENPKLSMFFEDFCIKNSIVEYYYLFGTSSFLLINNHGERKRISFIYPDHIHHILDILNDQNAPLELIDTLKSKKHFPVFPTIDAIYNDNYVSSWKKYIYEIKKIKNTQISYVLTPFLQE